METNKNKTFKAFDKVLVRSRRSGEWFPDIYQREYNGQHYVLGTDHGYNDDEIKFFKLFDIFIFQK